MIVIVIVIVGTDFSAEGLYDDFSIMLHQAKVSAGFFALWAQGFNGQRFRQGDAGFTGEVLQDAGAVTNFGEEGGHLGFCCRFGQLRDTLEV